MWIHAWVKFFWMKIRKSVRSFLKNWKIDLCHPAIPFIGINSVQIGHSVMVFSLQPHGLQHARTPCPSPTPGIYSKSWPLSQWCHPIILSCVVPFFSCPNLSQHQGIFKCSNYLHQVAKYWSFSFSISPSNEYSGLISFRMDWFNLLLSKGLSRVFSNTTVQSINSLVPSFL